MKLKPILAIALSLVLIVLGGMLPGLVGARMDPGADAQVEYAAVREVELEFTENDMTIREKLAILGNSTEAVEIPADLASRTVNEIARIATQEAENYEAAGILLRDVQDVDMERYCQPSLYYGRNSRSALFWNVSLSGREWYMNMVVDDATGTVCSVEYMSYEEENAYVDMEYILESFCGVFLKGLGEEFYDYTSGMVMEQTTSARDGSYLAGELSWNDADYGECRIIFFVAENRFSIYLN